MTVKIKYKGKGKLEHFLDGTNDYLEERTIINVVDFNMSDNFIIMRNYLGDEFKENQDDIESLRTYDPLYN